MSLPLSGKMASALPSLPLHGAHPPRLTGAGLPRRSQTAAILLTGRERSPRPPSPQSPFCNTPNGSGVWARPQTAAGAGQGGREEGSRAAEEGRRQRGLAPGAIRSLRGRGGGSVPACCGAERGPEPGCLSQSCILGGINAKTPFSAALTSPASGFFLTTVEAVSIRVLCESLIAHFRPKLREKPDRPAGSHAEEPPEGRGRGEQERSGNFCRPVQEVLTDIVSKTLEAENLPRSV